MAANGGTKLIIGIVTGLLIAGFTVSAASYLSHKESVDKTQSECIAKVQSEIATTTAVSVQQQKEIERRLVRIEEKVDKLAEAK